MENILIEGAIDTPEIQLNFSKNEVLFKGKSLPEDVDEFFSPIEKQISNFLFTAPQQIQLVFKMEYFNTASSKKIMDLIDLCRDSFSDNTDSVQVTWYYKPEDEDMYEAGEDLQDITGLQFSFKEF